MYANSYACNVIPPLLKPDHEVFATIGSPLVNITNHWAGGCTPCCCSCRCSRESLCPVGMGCCRARMLQPINPALCQPLNSFWDMQGCRFLVIFQHMCSHADP